MVIKIDPINQSRILFSRGMVFLFFTSTLNALRFTNHGKKGEGREILIFKAQLKAFNDVLSYGTKKGGG